MRRWLALATACALLAGCTATVTRQSYGCTRIGLTRELDTAERQDYERFQTLLHARTEAGTCIALSPGEQVRVGDETPDGDWKGVTLPNDPNSGIVTGYQGGLFWVPAYALEF